MSKFKRAGKIKYNPSWTDEQAKDMYNKLRKRSLGRIARLNKLYEEKGIKADALNRFSKESFPSVSKINNRYELRRLLTQAIEFDSLKTATVGGAKEANRKRLGFAEELGFDTKTMTNEQLSDFYDEYHKFMRTLNADYIPGTSGRAGRSDIMAFKSLYSNEDWLGATNQTKLKAMQFMTSAFEAERQGNFATADRWRKFAQDAIKGEGELFDSSQELEGGNL